MYTAKVLLSVAALTLTACASSPPTSQKRYEALVKVMTSHKPECRKYDSSSALGRDDTGSPECVRIQTAWVKRRRAARAEIDQAELEAAPSCTRDWHVSEIAMRASGVSPDDPMALRKMLRDGYQNVDFMGTPCAKQVCAWLSIRWIGSPYCERSDVEEARNISDYGPLPIPGRAAAASAEASRESPSRVGSTRSE